MQWFLNFLSGLLPLGVNSSGEKKSFGEWAGKILWVVVIVVACMLFVKGWEYIFPPKPVVQNIGTQIVGDQRDMMGFGCNMMRAYGRVGVKAK